MKQFKGWFGEKKTTFKLWLSLNSKNYHKFNNLILPSRNGTTQIDHLLVSCFGLFLIETKNRKGWIYGSEKQPNWTQTFYSKKYVFQNPIRQLFRQKKIVSEFLEIDEKLINTIAYFVGDCKFKTKLPSNVIKSNLGHYIKKYKEKIIEPDEIKRIVNVLQRHKSDTKLKNRDHIKSLKVRHSSNEICPKCGSKLVFRKSKQGKQIGSTFLGCESFPKCRFSKSVKFEMK